MTCIGTTSSVFHATKTGHVYCSFNRTMDDCDGGDDDDDDDDDDGRKSKSSGMLYHADL